MAIRNRTKYKLYVKHFSAEDSGQAIIEYLLTLIVTVAIITGVFYQLSNSFQAFASNYFGQYVKCLIQEGELPKLSIKQEENNNAVCDQAYQAFTLANGRPPKEGSKSDTSNTNQNNKVPPKKFRDGKPGNQSSTGSSRRGRGQSGFDNNSSSFGSSNNKGSNGKPQKSSNKNKIVVEGSNGSGYRGLGRKKSNSSDGLSTGKKKLVARIKLDPKKLKKNKGKTKANASKIKEQDSLQRKKSFRMSASVNKNTDQLKQETWDFSDYIRFLIIAVIIVVLLFVLGGQIMAAKKAQD